MKYSFVAIDFETTGFPPYGEIIEIGMVKVVNEQIVAKYNKLIKPCSQIPQDITIMTGITNEMVANKPSWSEIAEEVLDFLDDNILIAHNVDFDRGFLERALGYQISNPWVDTWDLSKIILPTLPSYQLKYLADYLKIKKLPFHRAVNDAEMTALIFNKLIKSLREKSPFLIEKIINIFSEDKNGLTEILTDILQQKISNFWLPVNEKEISEGIKENKETKLPFSFDQVERFFLPDGSLLSSYLNNYEFRPQQLEMVKIIEKTFAKNYHALIEAATGTGKTLAYLIPAILWAQENNTKIILSTNTIALQEQLFSSDIPFLEQSFNCKLPVSLVKGRNNYLCLRRFYKLLKDNRLLSWKEKVFLAQITIWLEKTKTGDKEEINLNSYENELWLGLASQVETCIGNKCSYSNQCYYLRTRKEAEKNSIIITNHSLLLLDLKTNNKVLPQYDYVIIDEAHNLEDEALKQFAQEVNFKYLKKNIYRLLKGKNTSLINQVNNYLNCHHPAEKNIKVFELIATIKNEGSNLETRLDQCINFIKSENISLNYELRITEKERFSIWWNNFSLILNDILSSLRIIIHNINILFNKIELIEELDEIIKEIRFLSGFLMEAYQTIDRFLSGIEEELVYWMHLYGDNLTLIITPLNIDEILKEKLFSKKKSVILTSATLAVDNSFSHILNMYGLEEEKVLTLISESPFNYQQQSVIYIPTDMPEPVGISDEEFANFVTKALAHLLPGVYGGILVLFTSYQMLDNVYYALKKEESLAYKEILAHGKDGGRKTLIETLKTKPNVILMGTSSFWEGIDIQGLGLTAVVIVKLPFSPPTRPVIAARLEALKKNNENSFYKYSLPEAILKFRQGYGRLIRSKKDWGALIILDKRVLSKNYGSKFINSLPLQPVIKSTTNNIAKQLSCWMNQNSAEK